MNITPHPHIEVPIAPLPIQLYVVCMEREEGVFKKVIQGVAEQVVAQQVKPLPTTLASLMGTASNSSYFTSDSVTFKHLRK